MVGEVLELGKGPYEGKSAVLRDVMNRIGYKVLDPSYVMRLSLGGAGSTAFLSSCYRTLQEAKKKESITGMDEWMDGCKSRDDSGPYGKIECVEFDPL